MAIPVLAGMAIEGKTVTGDAIFAQRKIATYLVEERKAHYHFTVKDNQPTLRADIELYFRDRGQPDYIEDWSLEHGRITRRRIWVTTDLNGYLDFPHVGQTFLVLRETINKKTGKPTEPESAYGITSRPPEQADAKRVLADNRGHWTIENGCHWVLDWNFDEDRSRIRTGHGPANVTRLRRFAIGVIKTRGAENIAGKMRQLNRNPRLLLDYLGMTENTRPKKARQPIQQAA
jgi:predicted transposase YbfD/YdcC